MNRIPPVATVTKREFGTCAGCGTRVNPGSSQCELCQRKKNYFDANGQPKADVPPTYGRNT